ncbi:MAG TPA: GxxExxY protein [Phycisphaerales bacterium]|nr:GxxExxY protein [Phycisphaerales bacterium]
MQTLTRAQYDQISGAILEVSVDVHRRLGPGLLESVYEAVLAHELRKRGFEVAVQTAVPVIWDDVRLEVGFRADLIVNDAGLIELKSVETIAPVHKKQTLTYLKLLDCRLGLLINFGADLIKDGLTRIANQLEGR